MDNNDPIEIRQVSNGFIIVPSNYNYKNVGCAISEFDTNVFQSMHELLSFIENHFEFRKATEFKNDSDAR